MPDDEKPEFDIYRDSYLRYLGYTNDIAEAVRPIASRIVVRALYTLDFGYILADTIDKSIKIRKRYSEKRAIYITVADVLLWQVLASVAISGFTINRITWATGRLLRFAKARKSFIDVVPTTVGMASIPVIVHPIDNCTDYIMDNTYRKWFGLS